MNALDKLKNAAAIIAPTVASFIGGPLAGQAVGQLSNWLLGKPDASPDEITAAIGNLTPEQISATRKNDQDYAARMKELDISAEKLGYDDLASARTLGVALAGAKDFTPRYLAFLTVLGAYGAAVGLMAGWLPAFKDPIVAGTAGTVIGYLFSELKAVMSYYFGSSAGSAAKTDLLAKADAIK